MSKRLKIVIAAAAGLLAVIIALGYLRVREQALLAMAAPQLVVVANADMAPGRIIGEGDVSVQQVPARYEQPGAFNDLSEVVNRIVVAAILQGEQVTASKVVFATAEPLAAKLPAGRRAVTMAVSAISGVSGLVEPGDYVDIIAIFDLGRSAREVVTEARFILQRSLVVAVDQDTGGVRVEQEGGQPPGTQTAQRRLAQTVTLALIPEDSQKLLLAQELGRLYLILRSARETEGEMAFEILDQQKMLDSELPIWREAIGEAEFRDQLMRQIPRR